MDREKIINWGKQFFRTALIIFLLTAVFNTGIFYGRYSAKDMSIINFFTTKKEISFNRFEGIPPIIIEQTEYYNAIVKLVWACLICLGMYFTLDYYVDKERHFITELKKKARGVAKWLSSE